MSAVPEEREATPLHIKTVRNYDTSPNDTNRHHDCGHYEILQKLITSSPAGGYETESAEIESCLEQFVGRDGLVLWRRVVVRSGPSCPKQIVHASYMLPQDSSYAPPFPDGTAATTDGVSRPSLLCWTAFPDRPDRPLLCVLANPTLLCIWDVYPSNPETEKEEQSQANPSQTEDLEGGEGQNIPLPFEACVIYGVGNGEHGLLLQRCESTEDIIAYHNYQQSINIADSMNDLEDQNNDDDGFILKAPPRPKRLRDSTGGGSTAMASLNVSTASTPTMMGGVGEGAAPNASLSSPLMIPSLFSLHHPQGDILPVSTSTAAAAAVATKGDLPRPQTSAFVATTDVFEKILFTGVVKWVDEAECATARRDFRQKSLPICVTYHSQLRRHAVWEIQHPPPPPQQAPLWQMSQQWRSKNARDSHLGVLQQDLEDFELADDPVDSSHHSDIPSRNDALADALGIVRRNTPRSNAGTAAISNATRSYRASSGSAGMSSNRSGKAKTPMNSSLLSPLSRSHTPTANGSHVLDGFRDGLTNAGFASDSTTRASFTRMGPFASLHPKANLNCIYVDSNSMPPAENIFLASNTSGSGTLSLCLVCPSSRGGVGPSVDNTKELTVYSLAPVVEKGRNFAVQPEGSVPCVAAQPIEASPIPRNYAPHRRNKYKTLTEMATDILLLRNHAPNESTLSLYRNTQHIVDCTITIPQSPELPVEMTDLKHSFRNVIDVVYWDSKTMQHQSIRGRLSLLLNSDSIGEALIQTVEAAFQTSMTLDVIALKIRADCIRLEQATSGVGAEIAKLVILSLFRFDILGIDVNAMEMDPCVKEATTIDQTQWEILLEYGNGEPFSVEYEEIFDESPVADGADWISERVKKGTSFVDLCKICSLSTQHLVSSGLIIGTTVFDSLHLFYEELKLHNSKQEEALSYIGSILCDICSMASCNTMQPRDVTESYLSYYSLDLEDHYQYSIAGDIRSDSGVKKASTRLEQFKLSSFSSPPSILSWIEEVICGNMASSQYEAFERADLNTTCRRIQSFLLIFPKLFEKDDSSGEDARINGESKDFEVVKLLLEEGFSDPDALRDELPVGVALPLLELLHRCRTSQIAYNSVMDPSVWLLIGREDISMKKSDSQQNQSHESKPPAPLNGLNSSPSLEEFGNNDKDGITQLESASSMLFPDDNRIREVGRLLRSSKPAYLHVPRAIEVSDHDYERQKQDKLLLLSRRILALPLGRGMLTIGNLKPVPAEPLPLPELCLSGRIPPTNTTMALDVSECPVDLKVWPEFHNGVAAGLRLPLQLEAGESVSKITRTWIVYNRPSNNNQADSQNNSNATENNSQNQNHAHGGLLMALGMRGHLTALEMTDIFDYLTHGSVTTTVGCLLGMAANMRGSCDISVSKMLCLHIPSLIPQHFSTIDVASTVQAAAVAGAGLLYEGSSHRMMTEFLLNEIGKRPSNDGNVLDREAYTLACGIALGMVNLCKGTENSVDNGVGLADLKIEERLYRYVVGGIDDAEIRRRYEETDRLSMPSASSSSNSDKCSCIYEGDSINIDVTAPGATLALGLMYMKSGNETIASAIALPQTHFLLEYVRPDFLMFRVISRALILWDDVQPTNEWIIAQVPRAAYNAYREMKDLAERLQCGGVDAAAGNDEPEYDRQAVRFIYTHVIAAACFSIGLRFAGTGNTDAASLIFERVMELRELRDALDPASTALRPPTPVIEMCLGCAAISLSMVLAGTGNLDALRLFKILRWPCTDDIYHGSHQAFGTAIGLLFLGGGTCTLGRDPKDIAALIMAFYPRFPSSTSDNQYHLQALRNLYALAVKKRELKAIDIDTGECVFAPIELHFRNKELEPMHFTAPCLLLNTDDEPFELRVVSKQHYPLTMSLDSNLGSKVFFVKRRGACIYDKSRPHSHTSLLMRSDKLEQRDSLDLVASFTDDQRILAFANHFCDFCEPKVQKHTSSPSMAQFCSRILHECFLRDTRQTLPLYLALRNSIHKVIAGRSARVAHVWDFRLVRSYYQNHGLTSRDGNSRRVLNCELVAYLIEMMELALADAKSSNKLLAIFYSYPRECRSKKNDTDDMDLT